LGGLGFLQSGNEMPVRERERERERERASGV